MKAVKGEQNYQRKVLMIYKSEMEECIRFSFRNTSALAFDGDNYYK